MEGKAHISKDGKYRYWLWRRWDKKKNICCFILFNPSTADAKKPDNTLDQCIYFAKKIGYGSLYVVNLFACRSPYPPDIKKESNPVGPNNDEVIIKYAKKADKIILAWGDDGSFINRDKEILDLLHKHNLKLYCLKVTKKKQPHHPLYLKRDEIISPVEFTF